MRSMTWALAGLLATALLLFSASHATPPEEATPDSATEDVAPVPIEELAINAAEMASGAGVRFEPNPGDTDPRAQQSKYELQLHELFETEAVDVARLHALIAEASEPMARLDLERRVAERKQETELSVLQLQLARARVEDRHDDVRELEASVHEMLHPTPVEPKNVPRERR